MACALRARVEALMPVCSRVMPLHTALAAAGLPDAAGLDNQVVNIDSHGVFRLEAARHAEGDVTASAAVSAQMA